MSQEFHKPLLIAATNYLLLALYSPFVILNDSHRISKDVMGKISIAAVLGVSSKTFQLCGLSLLPLSTAIIVQVHRGV